MMTKTRSCLIALFFVFVFSACGAQPNVQSISYTPPLPLTITAQVKQPCTYYETLCWDSYQQALKDQKEDLDKAHKACKEQVPTCHDRYTCAQKKLGIGPYADECTNYVAAEASDEEKSAFFLSQISKECHNAIEFGSWKAPKEYWQ